ncbi:MAG: methionine adenosyltransferase [Acidobacteria bacterium]|nr:methionine adenosyltransferase [Acidobacteriota bacterium]
MNDKGTFLFTSESVTEGHPDKLADRIVDAILDAVLARDPEARVACEALVTTGLVLISGEITTRAEVAYTQVARRTIREVGYSDSRCGFNSESCSVLCSIDSQSPDIALGVDTGGAGDQGLMFGYACRETEELMPLPITLAHRLARRLAEVRHRRVLGYLRPDGKTQVTLRYDRGRPVRVETIVVSAQHDPDVPLPRLQEEVRREVIDPVVPAGLLHPETVFHINPTGRFVHGGPQADTGLSGRKIIVDTYGGMGHHGGGSFSGKDPTKVDRSASYMARYIAKNLVAAGIAERAEVQLAYAIGVKEPVAVSVDTFRTGRIPEDRIESLVRESFGLTPAGIIRELDLRRPIYTPTSAYGHFGRGEDGFTWERTDRAEILRRAAGL